MAAVEPGSGGIGFGDQPVEADGSLPAALLRDVRTDVHRLRRRRPRLLLGGQGFGYSEPFSELPELSVLVVTFTMTAPMVAWMLFRGMPSRETTEMAVVMPILAIALLALGWLAIVPMGDLALLEHGLMMPAMLVPMVFRLDFYTGRAGPATTEKRSADANGGFCCAHRHRPLLAATRRGRPLRSLERKRLEWLRHGSMGESAATSTTRRCRSTFPRRGS